MTPDRQGGPVAELGLAERRQSKSTEDELLNVNEIALELTKLWAARHPQMQLDHLLASYAKFYELEQCLLNGDGTAEGYKKIMDRVRTEKKDSSESP